MKTTLRIVTKGTTIGLATFGIIVLATFLWAGTAIAKKRHDFRMPDPLLDRTEVVTMVRDHASRAETAELRALASAADTAQTALQAVREDADATKKTLKAAKKKARTARKAYFTALRDLTQTYADLAGALAIARTETKQERKIARLVARDPDVRVALLAEATRTQTRAIDNALTEVERIRAVIESSREADASKRELKALRRELRTARQTHSSAVANVLEDSETLRKKLLGDVQNQRDIRRIARLVNRDEDSLESIIKVASASQAEAIRTASARVETIRQQLGSARRSAFNRSSVPGLRNELRSAVRVQQDALKEVLEGEPNLREELRERARERISDKKRRRHHRRDRRHG